MPSSSSISRTGGFVFMDRLSRQEHPEGRALSRLALYFDPASVLGDDFLYQRQADARASCGIVPMSFASIETLENSLLLGRLNAAPLIRYGQTRGLPVGPQGNADR